MPLWLAREEVMPRPKSKPEKKSPRRQGALLILFTPEERDEIRAAADADDRPEGAWVRVVALREARRAKSGR